SKPSPPGGSPSTPERMNPNAESPYADAFLVAPATSDALAGLTMPLGDAMMTQRAVRRVHPDPVDDAVVLKCIELALQAPTGANGQNWEFIVVKDERIKKKLAKRYRQAWWIYYRVIRRGAARGKSLGKITQAVQGAGGHFTEIPVLVVPCLRLGASQGRLPFVPLPHAAQTGYFG